MDPASYVQTIAGILALLVLYIVFRSIRSSNGPKEYKSSTNYNKVPEPCGALPIIGHLHLLSASKPYFRTFSAMAQKYGPIFSLRLGCHRTIVVNNREIAKEFLITHDKVFASRASIAAGRYIGYNNAIFGLAPYGNYWREMRKISTLELLSSHRLEKLKHVRETEIYSLVKDLYSYAKNLMNDSIQVPMSKLLEHMTFNIVVRMIAGKRFRSETINEENSEGWRLRRAIKDTTYLSGVFVAADAIPYLSWFDFQGHVGFMKRTAKEIDFILDKWMHEHLRKRENHGCEDDFMDVLISMFDGQEMICGHKREIVIKATALVRPLDVDI
ncbi:Cytochrome P450 [Sesbania bispinosa]|nr:Cytochrome P450 [Sesbania bispinosa]